MTLRRGEIYLVKFPYTFDPRHLEGKNKFILILQGERFSEYNSVVVLLLTSNPESKNFETNVTIEQGQTELRKESYVICAQPYTILKSLIAEDTLCVGRLSNERMDEVDAKLFIGLGMGSYN